MDQNSHTVVPSQKKKDKRQESPRETREAKTLKLNSKRDGNGVLTVSLRQLRDNATSKKKRGEKQTDKVSQQGGG